jgi:hypothetical protein
VAYINLKLELVSDSFKGSISEFYPEGYGEAFSNGKTGRINRTGKLFTGWVDEFIQIDNIDYFLAKNEEKFTIFHRGKVSVQTRNGSSFYIDKTGKRKKIILF